jgi:hypothetical protein
MNNELTRLPNLGTYVEHDYTLDDACEILEALGITSTIEDIGTMTALVVTRDGTNALVATSVGVFHCPNWVGLTDNEYATELTEYPFNAESIARVIRDNLTKVGA